MKAMAIQEILEDWSEYERYKKGLGRNHFEFSISDPWEIDYLIGKILKAYPAQNIQAIRKAIDTCSFKISAPRHRRLFVQCVFQVLGLK